MSRGNGGRPPQAAFAAAVPMTKIILVMECFGAGESFPAYGGVFTEEYINDVTDS